MTVVNAPAKVLITGANGFVAVWIVQALIEAGYTVRGTVRSAEKGKFLEEKFGKKFETAVVPDVRKEGAFDAAVQGVDAVIHAAAPVSFSGTYDSVVQTAVDANLAILKSILDKGKSVRRVVDLSSFVAVWEPHDPGYSYTDADWNEYAIREATEKRDETPGHLLYFAGKTLSERKAWEFVEAHKKEIKWDFVALLPPYIFGPSIHERSSAGGFSSTGWMYDNLFTERSAEEAVTPQGSFIDVRDVARAHILALQKDKVGGERIIISNDYFAPQDINNIAAPLFPDIPKGHPEATHPPYGGPDVSKAAKILGLTEYIGLEKSVKDTIESAKEN